MARALLAAVVAVTAAGGRAVAGPTELGIAWQAPAACPDAHSVRDRIEQRLGRSLDDYLVGISVDVAPDHGSYVARVDLRAISVANDVRTLTSARCDELADAVAVIVARVATDAEATHRRAVRIAARDPVTTIASATPVVPRTPRVWSFGLRLSGVSGVGVLPEVGVGAEIAGYVRRRSAMVELAEMRWMASSQQVRTYEQAYVDIGLDVTSFRAGWRSEHLPLRAWCAVDVGNMKGSGVGLANNDVGSGRWVAAGAGFGVAWPMSRWARLVGMTEVVAAFERVQFHVNDIVIYQPAPMAARATVGLEVGWE